MNSKPKRYRLLKDLPDLMAEDEVIFERRGDITMPTHREYSFSRGGRRWHYPINLVENSPEWFAEIKEPEKIKVVSITDKYMDSETAGRKFEVLLNRPVWSNEHLRPIIDAVEMVLNDGKMFRFYTQEELDKAIVDAFKAAGLSFSRMGKNFDSAEDYLKSLKK